MKNKRIEYDTLGPKKIDSNRLWGAQTQRSLENFLYFNFLGSFIFNAE